MPFSIYVCYINFIYIYEISANFTAMTMSGSQGKECSPSITNKENEVQAIFQVMQPGKGPL